MKRVIPHGKCVLDMLMQDMMLLLVSVIRLRVALEIETSGEEPQLQPFPLLNRINQWRLTIDPHRPGKLIKT